MSNTAEKYQGFEGKFLSIDPVSGVRRETNYFEELARKTR